MKKRDRAVVLFVITVMCLSFPCTKTVYADDLSLADNNLSEIISDGYYEYYNQFAQQNTPAGFIAVEAGEALPGAKIDFISGRNAVVLQQYDKASWSFETKEAGTYNIYLNYIAMPGTQKDILLDVKIDGELPHDMSSGLQLCRIWKDAGYDGEGHFERDRYGNDIRPAQEEVFEWQRQTLFDVRGMYERPVFFFLEAGTHTIELNMTQGGIAVSEMEIGNETPPPDYKDYIKRYQDIQSPGKGVVFQQAEQAHRKSSSLLYATYDRADAATQPNSPSQIRMNTIGQSNWSTVGDYINWEVNVSEPGLYRLAFRVRQNINPGMKSYRTLLINGEVPFTQAENIGFDYSIKWYSHTLGGEENPYYVFLKPEDIVTLVCSPGEISEVLRGVNRLVLDLNATYRKIIAVTSTMPDIYRDYSLEKQIPELEKSLADMADLSQNVAKTATRVTGTNGSQASVLTHVEKLLRQFSADPDSIPERLSHFKTGIESLGSLILTLSNRPLEVDYIAYVPEGVAPPASGASLLQTVMFSVKRFILSFSSDYSSVGLSDTPSEENIKVWVSSGRDQVRILSHLIANDYEKKTGLRVNLNIVDTGATLIKAALAGKGPDAALMVQQDAPVNLAAREALLDLDSYGTDSLHSSINLSVLTPFYYKGKLYAYPETQVFDVLFYRKDVFNQMGISVPGTWDEFYQVMESLQKSNMMLGIPETNTVNLGVSQGIGIFSMFFFQRGGSYYSENLSKSRFDEEIAYEAFEQWVDLYHRYGLTREYDFYSRFRTGEMPIAIQNYTAYNQLSQAAPELRGLWNIAPVPGVRREDGSIDRSESGSLTGCIMLAGAKQRGVDKQTAQFLQWWTSVETQTAYGQELEAVLGVAARYTPAAKDALAQMGWSAEEFKVLSEQMDQVKPPSQPPGSYVLPRALTSAFRSSVNGDNQARRALTIYNKTINDELARKRKEFNLQ